MPAPDGPQFKNNKFDEHLSNFSNQTNVHLFGKNLVIGNVSVPTVRQNLVAKQKNGTTRYALEAHIPGAEGNLHTVTVHTFGDKPFYGLSLSENARSGENLDTDNLETFSKGIEPHLEKAENIPPSQTSTSPLGLSEQSVVDNHLDEWHRRGVLNSVQVHDWDTKESGTRVYDPVSGRLI
jgi:hypothetical protein